MCIAYQGPGVIKAVFGTFRGYAGNISAAGALDAVTNDGNALIIDIRCACMCIALHIQPTLEAFAGTPVELWPDPTSGEGPHTVAFGEGVSQMLKRRS